MLKKIKPVFWYAKNMGPGWVLFRLQYELKRRAGYFSRLNRKIVRRAERIDPQALSFSAPGLVNAAYRVETADTQAVLEKAQNALRGKIYAFSHNYLDYSDSDDSINWHRNPVSKVEAPRDIPWNLLPDFGAYGDIKLIWEASRFTQIYFFINAYSLTKDERFARGCLQQIEHWIDNNPFPYGVNYKCGQEISFRLFAWILALDYFHEFLTAPLTRKIVKNIYISLLRVAANIDFAAKSVKNNHSISEAAGLLIGGLLFPQFPESRQFVQTGLNYLQRELAYQVYDDGSYIQHSFNYQRLVLDVLSFVLTVARTVGFDLPPGIGEKHRQLLTFLNAFVRPNGFLPNYGHNDGSLLFPLGAAHYRDYRESLNWALAQHEADGVLFKDAQNLNRFFKFDGRKTVELKRPVQFETGGYFILKNERYFAFVRCHSFKHRPAHSDMLHLDVWHKGLNLFCDSGTYSYNTDRSLKKQFFGTLGHNTVMLNDADQMQEILHFGWANWLKSKTLHVLPRAFEGEHYGYLKRFNAVHRRKVSLDGNKLIVTDVISGKNEALNIKQIWNSPLEFKPVGQKGFENELCIVTSNIPGRLTQGLISEFYNDYQKGTRIVFEVETALPFTIETVIELK